jgi:hypothetical protein
VGSVGGLIDSFLAGWRRQAACADHPNERLTWTAEPNGGRENPGTVVKLLEVCATCPVRLPCLREALGESDVALVGAWGGTMWSERTRVLPQHNAAEWQSKSTRDASLERAEEILEGSLQERIRLWRDRAELELDQLYRLSGKRHAPGHPTAHLLTRAERPVEDKSITSIPWRDLYAARTEGGHATEQRSRMDRQLSAE